VLPNVMTGTRRTGVIPDDQEYPNRGDVHSLMNILIPASSPNKFVDFLSYDKGYVKRFIDEIANLTNS
jgi:hypothetical protein